MMTQQKVQLLRQIEHKYLQLKELIDKLEPAEFDHQPADGSWSARDILAHLAQWETVLVRFHLQGQDFSKAVEMDEVRYRETPFSVINEHLLQKQRRLSADQINVFAGQAHADMMSALEKLPAEALHKPAAHLAAQGYRADPLIEYISAITIEHYDDHLDSLRQLARRYSKNN